MTMNNLSDEQILALAKARGLITEKPAPKPAFRGFTALPIFKGHPMVAFVDGKSKPKSLSVKVAESMASYMLDTVKATAEQRKAWLDTFGPVAKTANAQ
jgi:hypothetical protein